MIRLNEKLNEGNIEDQGLLEFNKSAFDSNVSLEDAMSFWDKEFVSLADVSISDICDHDEDEFSFDIDLNEVKEILDKFREEKWNTLSDEERIDVIEEFKQVIGEKLELRDIPNIVFFEAEPEDCGYYDFESNTIGINSCELNNPIALLNTISHEMRHAFQYDKSNHPENDKEKMYRLNFEFYISPVFTEDGECVNFLEYQDQFIEAEARAFANYVIEGMEES